MKVGILQFFSWPGRRQALTSVYARAMQRIEIMEQSGYDAVWLTEHHFSDYSVCPSIPVMGAYAAARTRRLRIGAAVTLAAFYHPLRLAEELALLDILSGGRLNWGAGRGFDAHEFRTFGITMEQSAARFQEAVAIVLRAWQSGPMAYRGQFFSFDSIEVLPKPLQQPHPPVWIACGSAESLRYAAASGHSVLLGPHSTFAEMGRDRDLWRAELENHGHSMAGREVPMARLMAIAATDAEAERVARDGVKWLIQTYVDPRRFAPSGDPIERYLRSVVVHGTAERVADQIARIREDIGMDYLIGAPLSHETFVAFTERVLPALL
ncbi:MAG TPA: LLM class flavin-dependent oxidoreductase [Candidatus Binataceae bacterium]|nr:LLM class flavin-dependent oxidoreductase [Candidatus Binataceae bacterium]